MGPEPLEHTAPSLAATAPLTSATCPTGVREMTGGDSGPGLTRNDHWLNPSWDVPGRRMAKGFWNAAWQGSPKSRGRLPSALPQGGLARSCYSYTRRGGHKGQAQSPQPTPKPPLSHRSQPRPGLRQQQALTVAGTPVLLATGISGDSEAGKFWAELRSCKRPVPSPAPNSCHQAQGREEPQSSTNIPTGTRVIALQEGPWPAQGSIAGTPYGPLNPRSDAWCRARSRP